MQLIILLVSFACSQAALLPEKDGVQCSVGFSVQVENHVEGGYPDKNIKTVAGCADLCRMTSGCHGFDYDRNDPPFKDARCWIHSNHNPVVSGRSAVDHYSKGPLFCVSVLKDTFDVTRDHNAPGAAPYIQATTVGACPGLCRHYSWCVGYDFDTRDLPYKNTRCWIHSEKSALSRLPGIDHYSRVPPTSGPACYSQFSSETDRNVEGGIPHPHVMTESACANVCQSNPECVAFDYDRTAMPYQGCRCWTHEGPDLTVKDQPGVDHYSRGACSFRGACSSPLIRYTNSNAEGAAPYPGIDKVVDCADLCYGMPECTAFNFDHNDRPQEGARCWIHHSPSGVFKQKEGVDHYAKRPITCTTACIDDFVPSKELAAKGLTPIQEILTVSGCSDLCRQVADCVAFNYDWNDPPQEDARCWILEDSDFETENASGIDFFTRKPCQYESACMGEYSVRFGHNAAGAIPHPGISDVDACAEKCQSMSQCVGFDYDMNDPPNKLTRCWIHNNADLQVTELAGVHHYTKGKCASDLGCISNFDSIMECNAAGASPHYGYDSVAACADLCRQNPQCTAFDFDRNNPPSKGARCWIHEGSDLGLQEMPGIDHYTRIPCPLNTF